MHRMYTVRGTPGVTHRILVTDTAQTLEEAGVTLRINDRNPIGAFITVDNVAKTSQYHVRCTFGDPDSVEPTIVFGHILFAGDSIYLDNPLSVRTFQFINETQQNVARLYVTLEYEAGAGITV